MEVATTSIRFTEAEAEALNALRRKFTPADLERIDKRQRRTQALMARMVDASPEECVRLDGEFWRDLRAENRIMRAPARQPRVVAVIVPRARNREHRPRDTRRSSRSSSSSGGGDPGEPEQPEGPRWHGGGWLG